MNERIKITVALNLDLDELTILHRVFCSGMIGGDPRVRSRLYDKIVQLKREAISAAGITIDGTAETRRAAPGDDVLPQPVRVNKGRIR